MATYCDPETESWEWHDADSWHSPSRDRIERADIVRSADAVLPIQALIPLGREFVTLVSRWKRATENVSSLTAILSDPSYQRIIELGRRSDTIVPLILQDLRDHDGYWASALHALTGENPVQPKHVGNAAKVRKDWLEWGKRRGHI